MSARRPDEVAQMCSVLREASSRCAGFATSYAPTHRASTASGASRFSDRRELEALLGVLRDEHRGLFEITPARGAGRGVVRPAAAPAAFTYGALLTRPTDTTSEWWR